MLLLILAEKNLSLTKGYESAVGVLKVNQFIDVVLTLR